MFLISFFSSSGMDDDPGKYLFQTEHFVYIAACFLLFYLMMKLFVHSNELTRKILINSLLVLMLVLKYGGEIIFVSEWIQYGNTVSSFSHPLLDFRTLISFQLCGINNVLLPIVYWFKLHKMKDFVYTTSIIGGLAVMLYPVGILYGEPLAITFVMLRSLIVHFLLVFIPIFLIASGDFTLLKKNWIHTFIGAILVAVWALYGNIFIDTTANNMYMMENPFFGGPVPLLNILPNGFHLFIQVPLLFLAFVFVYFIIGKIQKHRDQWFTTQKNAIP